MIALSSLSQPWQSRLKPLADAEATTSAEVTKWRELLATRQAQLQAATQDWQRMKTTDVSSSDLTVAGVAQNSLHDAIEAIQSQLSEAQRRHGLLANALFGQLVGIAGMMARVQELDEQISRLTSERAELQATIDAPPPMPTPGEGTQVVVNLQGNASEVPGDFNVSSIPGLRVASEQETQTFRLLGVIV
jgi:DNA repair exonuclease SbcCD ATPase subunit